MKMEESGCVANVHTYTVMINGYCRNGKVDEANELFVKMKESGCLPDSCLINSIIQGFLLQNEMTKAIQYVDILRENGFLLDVYTEALLQNFQCCGVLEHSSKKGVEIFSQECIGE